MGGQELENSEALTTFRRSLYYSVYPEQGGKSSLGELFDAPDALECYRRTRSIVPQQALALTNSDLVHQTERRAHRGGDGESGERTRRFIVVAVSNDPARAPTPRIGSRLRPSSICLSKPCSNGFCRGRQAERSTRRLVPFVNTFGNSVKLRSRRTRRRKRAREPEESEPRAGATQSQRFHHDSIATWLKYGDAASRHERN